MVMVISCNVSYLSSKQSCGHPYLYPPSTTAVKYARVSNGDDDAVHEVAGGK